MPSGRNLSAALAHSGPAWSTARPPRPVLRARRGGPGHWVARRRCGPLPSGPSRRSPHRGRGGPAGSGRSCLPRTGAADAAMKGGRSVTIGGSIALIVIGAILRFGITWKPAHVDLQIIGVILMIAGVVGLIISIAFLATRRRG